MAVAHVATGPLGIVFLSGSIVLLFFVILSGVTQTPPLNNTYFLRASTSGITGARDISQWTYFFICGDGNTDCSAAVADLPLGYAWAGNPASPPPAELLGDYGGATTSRYFWYMWRFGWVFFLLSLLFAVVAFFASFLACCGRLGSAVAGLATMVALVFETVAVTMMTATFVKMRNVFIASGRDAQVGPAAFGFAWGSWTALLIATVLFCIGVRGSRDEKSSVRGASGGGLFSKFRRGSNSQRSRRSQDLSGRRVKDEYP